MKRYLQLFVCFVIACGLLAANQAQAASRTHLVHSSTPTLFFHGYDSGAHAEQYMVDGAINAGVSKTVITANVTPTGKVSLQGRIPKGAANPLVMVNFENSENTNYAVQGQWVKNVIVALQHTYHFKRMNIEAHSMGNMAVMNYLLVNDRNPHLPKLEKQVAIAGTFDGALNWKQPAHLTTNQKTGKPSAMNASFKRLLPLRSTYPRQVRVLNIYGDLGDGNDSQVSTASCQTLRYLVARRAKSYREVKLRGTNVAHELLHHNPRVNKMLIKFFWERS